MITVNGFSIVNEEEIDVFLELHCFLHDPMNVGNLISGSSDFLKPSLYIWKFLVQYCQSLAWRILRITLLAAGISLVAQMIENLTAMQETWVLVPGSGRSLGEGEWLLTPVFLPGESHKQRNLVGYSPWGCQESHMTEQLTLSLSLTSMWNEHNCMVTWIFFGITLLWDWTPWTG